MKSFQKQFFWGRNDLVRKSILCKAIFTNLVMFQSIQIKACYVFCLYVCTTHALFVINLRMCVIRPKAAVSVNFCAAILEYYLFCHLIVQSAIIISPHSYLNILSSLHGLDTCSLQDRW